MLVLWIVRRTAFAVACLGVIIGILAAPGHDVHAEVTSPSDVWDELLSPAAGIALAIIIRAGTSMAGLVLALPLARDFDAAGTASAATSGGRLSRLGDLLSATRGLRTLRLTRHVHDAALARLGTAGRPFERAEHAVLVANLALPVLFVAVVAATS